jgi:hypothetical protein
MTTLTEARTERGRALTNVADDVIDASAWRTCHHCGSATPKLREDCDYCGETA